MWVRVCLVDKSSGTRHLLSLYLPAFLLTVSFVGPYSPPLRQLTSHGRHHPLFNLITFFYQYLHGSCYNYSIIIFTSSIKLVGCKGNSLFFLSPSLSPNHPLFKSIWLNLSQLFSFTLTKYSFLDHSLSLNNVTSTSCLPHGSLYNLWLLVIPTFFLFIVNPFTCFHM